MLGWPTGGRWASASLVFLDHPVLSPFPGLSSATGPRESMPTSFPAGSWPGVCHRGVGGAPRCHSGLVPGSLGKRARGHTVGPEPSRMSPQSGFLRVRGCGDGRKKVLRAEAGAGRQCVWVRQMRGSEVISEWRRGGQVEAGGLTQGSRAWLFPARTTGHQLVLDRGKSPGNSCHHSSCRDPRRRGDR